MGVGSTVGSYSILLESKTRERVELRGAAIHGLGRRTDPGEAFAAAAWVKAVLSDLHSATDVKSNKHRKTASGVAGVAQICSAIWCDRSGVAALYGRVIGSRS